MMDLPQNLDDAIQVAAFAEATGPTLPGIIIQAATHDALTGAGQFAGVLEVVLPIARACTILFHAYEQADEAAAERLGLIERMKAGIERMAAAEAAKKAVPPRYEGQAVTGVAWSGNPGVYAENMPAINHELAKGIVAMVKANEAAAERAQIAPDAIETTESGPKQASNDPRNGAPELPNGSATPTQGEAP